MKKFLAFILAALMLLALAACGSNGGNTDPQETPQRIQRIV